MNRSVNEPGGPDADDPRIIAALDEYMSAVKAGQIPNREALQARYPEIAAVLAECLEGLEVIRHAAAGDQAAAPAPPAGGVESGTALGDYRIAREIGRGGMGVVYEAEQLSLGRRVALKVLPFASTLDARQLQRFQNEAHAAAHLHHTNIVPVFATGCERGVHYYAMQFIEGQTLATLIAELRRQSGSAHREQEQDLTTAYPPRACRMRPGADRAAGGPPHRTLDAHSGPLSDWSLGSGCRRPRPWNMPISWASSIATSSRPTCWWMGAATCGSPISAWPTARARPA